MEYEKDEARSSVRKPAECPGAVRHVLYEVVRGYFVFFIAEFDTSWAVAFLEKRLGKCVCRENSRP